MNQAKPGSVTFISWRFSRAAAASWVSKAKDKVPLPDLPFEGYIQSTTEFLSLPRLHRWIQDAIWENVSGKLSLSRAYQEFSAPDDAFEYDNDGSPALSKGGRRKTLPTVSTDSTMSIDSTMSTHTPPPAGAGSPLLPEWGVHIMHSPLCCCCSKCYSRCHSNCCSKCHTNIQKVHSCNCYSYSC